MTDLRAATPLVLVGAGKMGGAMLAGWLENGLDPKGVVLIDPAPPPEMAELIASRGMTHVTAPPSDLKAAVIVVAVKPQVADAVLPGLAGLVGPGTVVVSVAAGKTLERLEAGIGPAAIVRSMPNTPAQVGRGITVAVANGRVTTPQKVLVTALLAAVGKVEWVAEEALIDAVTAVSGSGPAYVFHLVEAMAEAGRRAGLPDALAEKLARATVEGAGELLYQSPLDPATLRKNVTSPNGTTAAALAVLMGEAGLQPIMDAAVAAAARRSRELAG
ncbi:pyrroline-5-carboxylate reductase [Prosthecomicrobium hirschii]|uniref:pyrroline-5-carboxylate reductase n=1 Tax=Prosthecodimorpha hirschii TaxID=665126 RepID=UPI00112725BA|nr:pyrroline-5-carboxylate reductase [Prosthecomicrobium hirschii]TPQ46184.1 pyrroline-5-carboxylate reductase [Prosthecomicrobium hirschii]